MNIDILLNATPPIPVHALAAFAAAALGAAQLAMQKGTKAHRLLGYIWVALMALVAASGLFIYEIQLWGRYSPIHLLSFLTLGSLVLAVRYARKGMIKQHKIVMVMLFVFALLITGAFTFLPGRIMHQVLFGA